MLHTGTIRNDTFGYFFGYNFKFRKLSISHGMEMWHYLTSLDCY